MWITFSWGERNRTSILTSKEWCPAVRRLPNSNTNNLCWFVWVRICTLQSLSLHLLELGVSFSSDEYKFFSYTSGIYRPSILIFQIQLCVYLLHHHTAHNIGIAPIKTRFGVSSEYLSSLCMLLYVIDVWGANMLPLIHSHHLKILDI